MNVLFLTVATGQGHISCAHAMDGYLREKGINTHMMDIYEYISPYLSKTFSELYSFASGKVPKLYGKMYSIEERGKVKALSTVEGVNIMIAGKIRKYIIKNKIDVVIATHLFGGQLMTRLKKEMDIKTMGIVTDFTIHPHWENTNLDYYVLADKGLESQGIARGMRPESLKSFGIPFNPKFAQKRDKAAAKAALGFDDRPLVFVMMGSMGYGNILRVLEGLDDTDIDYNVAVVCGNNKRALRQIDKSSFRKNIVSYGFVNNVDLMMDAADCIVTKPGGLSVTESLAKKLPMIFTDPIPGQEERNLEFLLNNGVGIKLSDTYSIGDALHLLFDDPARRDEMIQPIGRIAKTDATQKLCEFILQM